MSSDYSRAYREWVEDDEPWPGPEDGALGFGGLMEYLRKYLDQSFSASLWAQDFNRAQPNFGTHIHATLVDEISKPLKDLAAHIAKLAEPSEIPRYDPRLPTRKPHSMTGDGKVFDRRGRRKR